MKENLLLDWMSNFNVDFFPHEKIEVGDWFVSKDLQKRDTWNIVKCENVEQAEKSNSNDDCIKIKPTE